MIVVPRLMGHDPQTREALLPVPLKEGEGGRQQPDSQDRTAAGNGVLTLIGIHHWGPGGSESPSQGSPCLQMWKKSKKGHFLFVTKLVDPCLFFAFFIC